MNDDDQNETAQLPALPESGRQLVVQTITDAFSDADPLVYIDRALKGLNAASAGDALPILERALQSVGTFFLGQKSLEGGNFKNAREYFYKAATGFEELGENELYDLARGLGGYTEAVIAVQGRNVGVARELLAQVQEHLHKAGQFGQRFQPLIDQIQPDVLFVQALEALMALDYNAAKPLIEQASQAALFVARTYHDEGTPAHFLFLGLSHCYRAFYTMTRALNDLNRYAFEGLAAEIDLKNEAVQARDLLSKTGITTSQVKGLIHLSDGIIELLDLVGQLSPIMQMVFNSTYKPNPAVYESLRQKIRRANDSFAKAGPLAVPMIRFCDQLSHQIDNLERLAKPKPMEMTGLSIVILVHGIRTFANWQDTVRRELETAGLQVELTNYEYFDLIRFLLPVKRFRAKAISGVLQQIRTVEVLHPGARISILAHSFGTYITAEIMRNEPDIKVDRLLFCGSIVPSSYPFYQVMARIEAKDGFLNDVGSRDVWPALAESVTTGYGRTGTYGFRSPGIRDRWHDLDHSGFLTAEFCRKFWIPFFLHGTRTDGDDTHSDPPFWLRLVSVFKIKYILLILLAGLVWWLWPLLPTKM